jgi:tRNA-Thr(GGU) m(6)t(6)A37 methyltransferase TsaA
MRSQDVAGRVAPPRPLAEEKIFMNFTLRSIGHIRTPYQTLRECPRNIDPEGPICELVIDEHFLDGLAGLITGENILVLYWFENVDREVLLQQRRESGCKRGVFALRSPHRPNPIGAATVKIESIVNQCIRVRGMDCLDGTPLLDIKPAIFPNPVKGSQAQLDL